MAQQTYLFANERLFRELFGIRLAETSDFLEEAFSVSLTSRSGVLEITGEDPSCAACHAFCGELERFAAENASVDRRDLELLYKGFARHGAEDLHRICAARIPVGSHRRDVLPRTLNQLNYVRAMQKCDVIFGIGPAGTGKTFLAMAMAVSTYLAGGCSRIILTRPARESGENLGFLPGNLEEKIMPYLRPLYDALYSMLSPGEAADLLKNNILEIAPLAFMRGRTLEDAFIILDEAQNTTADQMLMFLTRMGFHSKCVITGDPGQSDLGPREKSGLLRAEKTLKGIPGIAFCTFDTGDVLRHSLLEKIIRAYNGNGTEGPDHV